MVYGGRIDDVLGEIERPVSAPAGIGRMAGKNFEVKVYREATMGLIDSDMNDLKYEIEEETRLGTRIKVIGVGGGGCNAGARMGRGGLGGARTGEDKAGTQ